MHPYLDNRARSKLRLRHLELLDVLGEGLNVHGAAARMSLTQPAITKMLQDIELIYNAQLFERLSRGLRPTRAGESAIKWARLILGNVGESLAESQMIAAGAAGTIRVGCLAVAIPTLVSETLALLANEAPNLVVSVAEGGIQSLMPALGRNEFDIVLGRLSAITRESPFAFEQLYDEAQLCIVARHDHPLALRDALTVEDLEFVRWILPPEPAPIRQAVATVLQKAGLPFANAAIEATSLLLLELLMSKTDLVAPLPFRVAQHFQQQKNFAILPLAVPIQMPPVGMIWNASVPASPILQTFMAALRRSAEKLGTPVVSVA